MPIELPFIGQVDEKEQKLWIKAINSAAERFKLLPSVTVYRSYD